MKAIKAIYNGIDKFNDFLGRIFSVLSLAILAVIMCEVILRRIFNRPQIWTQDLIVMLFACYIILISAYGLQKKAFVAVDVVYAMFPVRVQHILHRHIRDLPGPLPDGSRSRQLDLLPERVYHR
mgnify:CR=1 FL=1